MQKITLTPGELTLANLRSVWKSFQTLELATASYAAIHESEAVVAEIVAKDKKVYGINTGFGRLANTVIPADQLKELQRRLVLSHATGVGSLLPDNVVRLILLLKINALAQGYSGIRLEVIETLIKFYNAEIYPCIPGKGSVGASGDLAPLAHLSTALLGVGQVRHQNEILSAEQALKLINAKPVELAPKEGLALLNGTQVSTALALAALFSLEDIFAAAVTAGALSVDAATGSDTPFEERIQSIRRQRGQQVVAKIYRNLLAGSVIRDSHLNCPRVQDPYSLRCQPQVMGACLDYINFVAEKLLLETNAVSDNPIVFADKGEILAGGNFHAEPVALAADVMALCLAEIGNISERRIALLIDAQLSGLPAFLVSKPGINSGFMIAHVTASALASENKILAHPGSVDNIPTSVNQEDHVSMATHSARRLLEMAENTGNIVAIELLAACQGIDLRQPLATSPLLQQALQMVRSKVSYYDQDRLFAPDIAAIKELVTDGAFHRFMVESKTCSAGKRSASIFNSIEENA